MPKRKPDPTETPPLEDDLDEEALVEAIAEAESEAEPAAVRLADEPMFSALLRAAVQKVVPDDTVLLDYVAHVAQPLSAELALQPAKGGEEFLAARRAEGKSEADVARYRHEQSLRAHLINGLFPAARIARLLKKWGAPRLRHFDEAREGGYVYRLFCAGFTLHDWLKLPEVEAWLDREGLDHAAVSAAKHLPLVEAIFREWLARLGLDEFLTPIGGAEAWLHDLIYLACNAQVRWGTMLNLSQLPRLQLDGRQRQLATDLCTLADRIAYVAKTPREVTAHRGITELITNLSDGQARLVYHHVAEIRGLLTNFIHNAALAALSGPAREPLLYAPSGVVYLEHTARAAAWPDTLAADVAEATVREIRTACSGRLNREFTGLSRDGKGLKTAPYYDLHFAPGEQIRLAARAVFKMIPETKPPAAGKRYASMIQKAMAPDGVDLALPDDVRVDQLAEFCAMAAGIAEGAAPGLDAASVILEALGLSRERATCDAIAGAKGGGGVPYAWYYVAGVYLGRGKGKGAAPDEWRALIEGLAQTLAQVVEETSEVSGEPAVRTTSEVCGADGWADVRAYVQRVLTVGPMAGAGPADALRETAALELARYSAAKMRGRGATVVCSLCSSACEVNAQREAGLLFAPQVYTNKQPLHGSKAIRNICRICETEMMLRQILMNRGGALGSRFEGRRVRYLYFYPTYFFTPETLAQLALVYRRLRRVSFTSVRKALLAEENGRATLRLDAAAFQHLQPLLMEPLADEPSQEDDRIFRFHFPEQQPVAFYFLGMPPPGRDAKDAEAWVNPAFLALILPLALDVKVVASESSMPLLTEADELDETVFMDAPHDFVADLLGRERITLEGLLPRLQALTAAYLIHLDGNARMGRGGYDYRWHAIPPLARNLSADPAWAFAYLKKWQRANGIEAMPADKAHIYLQLVEILVTLKGGHTMSHARTLTEHYMRFYRAKRRNSNSILRPISIASRAILAADPRLFDHEGLVEAVYGELRDFMDRVGSGRADGRFAPGSNWESREAAMRQFAAYFVGDIFYDTLRGDKSALRGKQLNLLKNACEAIYRDVAAQEWRDRQEAEEEEEA